MHDPPQDRQGPGFSSRPAGDGIGFRKWWRVDRTKGGEPTGVYRDASGVEVGKRGCTDRGKGFRSGTWRRDAGVKSNLGIRLRAKIKRVQGRAVEAGRSV